MKKFLTLFAALLLLGSTTVKADDTYVVAGSSTDIFGASWNGSKSENQMTWEAGRSMFVKEYTVTAAVAEVELKVVKNGNEWNGDFLGNNVKFGLSGAGSFTVLFNTETGIASVEGAIVIPKSNYSVYATGNGSGNWLNGKNWEEGNSSNKMTEVEPNVWEITFNDVSKVNGRQLKFTINGSWDVNFGGTFSSFDAATNAVSSGDNITFNSPGETSISARLDLRKCKSSDKTGAKFTVSSGSLPDLHYCYVAGSEAEIFGTAWTTNLPANQMTLDGTKYSKTYTVTKAYKSVALKAVYDDAWYGDNGEDLRFSLSGAGQFTVKFDKNTHEVTVEGSIVGEETFDINSVTIAGNGTSGKTWMNGINWAPDAAANLMTEVSTGVYEISFDNVEGTQCEFKFAFNGAWDYQMSGTFSSFGTATTAVYSKSDNIIFTPIAGAAITIRLDLSNFNYFTKQGATFTVLQEPDAFVAGSVAEIFGTAWTAGLAANQMTWDAVESKYKKVYTVDKAYKSVALKVKYDDPDQWYGVNGGESNVTFSLSGAGEFTVWFDKTTHHVTLSGEIVGDEQFDFEYVAVAANGEGNWAHGEDWNAATTTNRMTKITPNVWEISFDNVPAKDCQFKFCFDGTWDHEFGGTFSAFGTASPAEYGNASHSIDFTSIEGSKITIRLDLSAFNFATKEGATFTVSQVEPAPTFMTVREDLTAGWYYTMCLNKAVTAVQGASIWRVVSKAANGSDIILEEVEGTLDAGRPYIFYATATTLQVMYTGAAVDAPVTTDNNGLVGSFEKASIAKDDNNYIIYNNMLYLVDSDNVKVGANRAYLHMGDVPAYSGAASAPGRRRVTMTVYNEQTTTDIDVLNASEAPVKMIIDGQLFIIRGEKMYNVNGQVVK